MGRRSSRVAIASVDADIPVFNVSTLDARMDEVMAEARSRSSIVSVFALFALVLTTAGLYAAMSGRIVRRRRELASTRYMASQLFGLSPGDPATFAVASLGLASLGLLAAYVPARRAARVDPMIAL